MTHQNPAPELGAKMSESHPSSHLRLAVFFLMFRSGEPRRFRVAQHVDALVLDRDEQMSNKC